MKRYRLLLVFFLFTNLCIAQEDIDQLLTELDETLAKIEFYTRLKINTIDSLKKDLALSGQTPDILFDKYLNLGLEYQTFNFDSSFYYLEEAIGQAYLTHSSADLVRAKTEFGNILISTGMFKESFDTLGSIDPINQNPDIKARYYNVLGRFYIDLKNYVQTGYYADKYRKKGLAAYDSALFYFPANSTQYLSLYAYVNYISGNTELARTSYEKLIKTFDLPNDQLAIESSALSFVYQDLNQHDLALQSMIVASIADIKGAKKEAVALMHVANSLYERGDIIRASRYINIALEESNFYGSNLRLTQIARFLPIIKSKHIQTVEIQKKKLLRFAIALSLLSLVIIGFIIIIVIQIQKIKHTKKKLEDSYKKLQKTNDQLTESNRIKEEYIGYYFSANSQMIEKLDNLKKSILRKYNLRRFDDIAYDLKNLNIQEERENLFINFDRVFLKIFPDFVERFNLLLHEEDRVVTSEDQLLNTDLRIFALIRLGIHDNEKIAKILERKLKQNIIPFRMIFYNLFLIKCGHL